MRAGAVPGMGFVTPFAGGSETRPAGPDAGLRGARCPGGERSHIRWRCHEARDRTEPTPKGLARAVVERRKASAAPKRGRAPRTRPAVTLRLRGAVSQYAPFGAPPPLMGGPFVKTFGKPRGANKKRSARTMVLVIASQRTRAMSRCPMTGSAKQSRAACDGREARWIASSLRSSQ
jgi:hypothetical protein